jgi:hypothetical protein
MNGEERRISYEFSKSTALELDLHASYWFEQRTMDLD